MIETKNGFRVIAHVVMILLALFCLLPFVLLIASSITDESALIRNGYSFLPAAFDFSAYRFLLMDSNSIVRAYEITVLITAIGTAANIGLTTLMAYPLSRKELPGRNVVAFFIFFTLLFSGGLVPSYIMWTQYFHIKNTLSALVVPGLLLNGFNVILMRTYFTTTIPSEVVEAAKIDGGSEYNILMKVVLPLSLPIMATLGVLVGLSYWNDWLNGLYYVTDDRLFSIQFLLNKMLLDVQFLTSSASAGLSSDLSARLPSTAIKMAVAVLGVLPIMAIYPFFQKFFVKGVTVGAVKG
ncbi:carbohydrate ABC transporter permease [Paenibacillus sp. CF384]|uniref:carbohydrate ABC transporter permease n=1 Tax=Paenibacillus sp. CF384 TaxID=1884382 RepID=UPI0008993064|nr:carbohydrate ABC transporter permease [Paenibacillus sp. CF384]SDW47909.1 putative aldouronate transport system permease protein [Paenibacillus sp. CF384]